MDDFEIGFLESKITGMEFELADMYLQIRDLQVQLSEAYQEISDLKEQLDERKQMKPEESEGFESLFWRDFREDMKNPEYRQSYEETSFGFELWEHVERDHETVLSTHLFSEVWDIHYKMHKDHNNWDHTIHWYDIEE